MQNRTGFDPERSGLPVSEVIGETRAHLAVHNALILAAPPGAGKSTVLPLALLNEPWLAGRKIIMLEPRRLAASSVANRMAQLLGEAVGATVGYRIRFDTRISASTRIEVVTEGILTRMLQQDNSLEDVGLIIFDEFHERSIHADTALALSKEVQDVLRPDLRLLIMSATADLQKLSDRLGAPVVESQGRLFPVEIIYTPEQHTPLPALCSRTVIRALKEHEGDILVFLPGQAEIRKCEELLAGQLKGVSLYSLYGQLSHSQQQAAILPDPGGRRKVVLSTSLAETSLTIEGVRVVIDSGLTRRSVYDPVRGLSGLSTVQVTADSADQRAGRAGRLSPGVCYRLWSTATQQRLVPFRKPEIADADLAPLLLELYKWGVTDAGRLFWLDQPPPAGMAGAVQLLETLGAVKEGRLTPHGRRMYDLPCHPRIANMLLQAESPAELNLAADLAALLEEKDPLDNRTAGTDINLRIEALRRFRSDKRPDGRWEKIEKVAAGYRKFFGISGSVNQPDHYQAGQVLISAYPERIAMERGKSSGSYLLANGSAAEMNQEDPLAGEAFLVAPQIDGQRGQTKIFLAAPLDLKDISGLATETKNIRWDSRRGMLVATADLKLGSLVLRSKPLENVSGDELNAVLEEAIKTEGKTMFTFSEPVAQWQNRVNSLKIWNPDEDWPDVSTDALIQRCSEWLGPYYTQLRRAEDFGKLDLLTILNHSLSFEHQRLLAQLAPDSIPVPSGFKVPLEYFANGESPVLSVRLQELFGMLDTPMINRGRNQVVIHLLSPGYKPVQVTSDLRSFWSNAYFEVRKELKRRYPKHSWPEDPLNAVAVRGVKRKS